MYGVQIAFRDFKVSLGITGSEWVGLKHIIRFIESPIFFTTLRNTLIISLYSLICSPLPLIFALMLHYLPFRRYRQVIQMMSYAPHFISTVVMVGIILQFLSKDAGMVNALLEPFGTEPQNWMAKPEYFFHIFQWSGVWQGIGYASIIYFAALSSVSVELHEAAIVDGADILKRIWYVDIPSVLPTLCILLILDCGSLLSVGYEKIFLMQNNLNRDVSEVISTYVFKQGLTAAIPQYSYSAAVDLFIAFINAGMLIVVNAITKKLSGNGLW